MRAHGTGSIVWSNKKDFDLVQSRLEPSPFVCPSQLLPEMAMHVTPVSVAATRPSALRQVR
jgi:hypothetical protein